jgi:LacI family transcriptional regulator
VDGIIDAAADIFDPKMIEVFEQGLPIVTVNRAIQGCSIPSIINDDTAGMQLLLKFLVEKGHRKIAHVAGPQFLTTGRTRLQVLENTLKDSKPQYRDYIKKTNSFFPWFPKNK